MNILNFQRTRTYTDLELVDGIHKRDHGVEEWFYRTAQRYYDDHFGELFYDEDLRQEIFHTAFLKLWTEMENGRIRALDGKVCRQQPDGDYREMTCRLTTFLMAFARTEYHDMVRARRECTIPEITDTVAGTVEAPDDSPEEQRCRVVDECISQMPKRCMEILTMFYYQQLSLDEIMALRPEHKSKNGLKTAYDKCMNSLRARVTEALRT